MVAWSLDPMMHMGLLVFISCMVAARAFGESMRWCKGLEREHVGSIGGKVRSHTRL